MTEAHCYDKHGVPIERGDIVKVFHFIGARRKRHYMYKQCLGIGRYPSSPPDWQAVFFSHLNFCEIGDRNGPYHETPGKRLMDYEIVQSIKCDHDERLFLQAATQQPVQAAPVGRERLDKILREACEPDDPKATYRFFLPEDPYGDRGRALDAILAALSQPAPEAGEVGNETRRTIALIAEVANQIGWQAGEPGMEIAGGIVAFLAAHPEHIDRFMRDPNEVMSDGTFDPHEGGLTWRTTKGEIINREIYRERKAALSPVAGGGEK